MRSTSLVLPIQLYSLHRGSDDWDVLVREGLHPLLAGDRSLDVLSEFLCLGVLAGLALRGEGSHYFVGEELEGFADVFMAVAARLLHEDSGSVFG